AEVDAAAQRAGRMDAAAVLLLERAPAVGAGPVDPLAGERHPGTLERVRGLKAGDVEAVAGFLKVAAAAGRPARRAARLDRRGDVGVDRFQVRGDGGIGGRGGACGGGGRGARGGGGRGRGGAVGGGGGGGGGGGAGAGGAAGGAGRPGGGRAGERRGGRGGGGIEGKPGHGGARGVTHRAAN